MLASASLAERSDTTVTCVFPVPVPCSCSLFPQDTEGTSCSLFLFPQGKSIAANVCEGPESYFLVSFTHKFWSFLGCLGGVVCFGLVLLLWV